MKLFFFLFFLSKPLLAQDLILSLGERRTVPASSSVWIENKKILTARAEGGMLVLQPQKIGSSLARFRGRTETIQVVDPRQFDSFERLRKTCAVLPGLKADFTRGVLAVHGNLFRAQDWRKLASLGLHYSMRAHLTSELQDEMQNSLQELMRKAKLPKQVLIFSDGVEVRVSPKSIYREKYEALLSPYGIDVVADNDSLETAPTIKVQITVAEIKRDLTMKYGLKWPSSYAATILRTGKREFDDLPFNATALEAQGWGKILASPNIICRSGKEAEFLAGGEFPIKIMNYKMQDIVWKKYGILLKVKPQADSSGRMSISIETEVSTLDDSRKVDDIPGILTNHVSSHFDLARPQTIALSGLIKSEDSRSHEGVPFLSRLPVIGALFSSRDFKENRSELVIFVRPSILEDEVEHVEKPSHIGDIK